MKKQNKKKLVVGVVSVLAICITLIVITKMHVEATNTQCLKGIRFSMWNAGFILAIQLLRLQKKP